MPDYKIVKATEQGSWGVCFLLYSTSGAGKTTLAGSAANSKEHGAPVLFIDAEGSTRVVSDREDIDVIPINDLESGRGGYAWPRILEVADDLAAGKHGLDRYKTVVFDNLSEYNDACLRWVVRTFNRPNIKPQDRPDQNDWGKSTAEMLMFVRRMRDYGRNSGTNIVFIAWEMAQMNDLGQQIGERLMFNPGLSKKLPGIVDSVGFLRVVDGKTGQRELTFAASERTDAKFRRSGTEIASRIPDVMRWTNKEDCPLPSILATLRANTEFPTAKYNPRVALAQNTKEVLTNASS